MKLKILSFLLPLIVQFLVLQASAADRCDEMVAAAIEGEVPRIAELVNGGGGINCRDPLSDETPLMAAAENGRVDAVKLLLSLGADPNAKSAGGETALDKVRAREAAFAKIPNFAELAQHQREVIALLQKRVAGPQKAVKPVKVQPADPNVVARLKLEGAQAALMGGQYGAARKSILEVLKMSGVSKERRAQAYALSCDLGMRDRQWAQAKTACEKVLNTPESSEQERTRATDNLQTLREYHPKLFR